MSADFVDGSNTGLSTRRQLFVSHVKPKFDVDSIFYSKHIKVLFVPKRYLFGLVLKQHGEAFWQATYAPGSNSTLYCVGSRTTLPATNMRTP